MTNYADFSIVFMSGWVGSENDHLCRLQYCIYLCLGGSEKAQKYADVIYEWSLCDLFCVKNLFTGSHPTYPKTISVTSKVRIDFTNSYVGNLN